MYRLNSRDSPSIRNVCSRFLAEQYINENIEIAKNWIKPICQRRLSNWLLFILIGLFIQANDIFKSINCSDLQVIYRLCIVGIAFGIMKLQIKYTDDARFASEYLVEKEAYRDVASILHDASEEYSKERAIKLQDQGKTKEALKILTKIYQKENQNSWVCNDVYGANKSMNGWSESMNWKKSILY